MPTAPLDEDHRARALLDAQDRAAALFEAVSDSGIIRAGVSESAATEAVTDMATEMFGVERHWHKRIVRSGPNSVLAYPEDPPDRVIGEDDIVFADFGPVFDGWEADFGRTWVIGDDPDKHRLVRDLTEVFALGRAHADRHVELTGEELYRYVVSLASERGWAFGNHHCGHLVGEYPHEDFPGPRPASHLMEGAVEPLRRLDPSGRVAHWILEVHLVDPQRRYGGFHEQLLTL